MTTTTQTACTLTPAELTEKYNRQITLSNVKSGRAHTDYWTNWEYQLSNEEINQIAEMLGGFHRTRAIVRRRLASLSTLPGQWFFDRIVWCKHTNKWSYVAGQDYPAELATIRKWFLNL
jgi:hypothetical protein